MWDPTVGLGTVTHEYIGYLLPMGPFFWLFHAARDPGLGGPAAVARLPPLRRGRPASSTCAGAARAARARAGGGRRWPTCCRPYFLQYAGRISVILLPWSGLPFMVGLTIARRCAAAGGGTGAFALVVALVSGINATSHHLRRRRARALAPLRRRRSCGRRPGVRPWATGLRMGVSHLRRVVVVDRRPRGRGRLRRRRPEVHRDGPVDVSRPPTPSEVIRGLGYWYFYGIDHLGRGPTRSVQYTQQLWLIGDRSLCRARGRPGPGRLRALARTGSFFILLFVVDWCSPSAPSPSADPSRFGSFLKSFMTDTTAGLALRSTDRATPLVLLGLAMLLGAGVTALWRRCPAGCSRPAGRRPRRGQQPRHLQRRHRRRQLHPAGVAARATRWPPHAPERHAPGHPGAGHPRQRLRRVRGATRSTLLQPGLLEPGLRAPGSSRSWGRSRPPTPSTPRRPHPGRHRPLQRAGPHGPAHGRRRRAGRVRPALRALRPRPAPAAVGPNSATRLRARPTPFASARRAERADSLRRSTSRTWPRRPTRRGPRPWSTIPCRDPRPSSGPSPTRGALVIDGDATGLATGRRRPAEHRQRHLLRRHPRATIRRGSGLAERGPPGGDRHQPQAGVPLGHPPRPTPATPRRRATIRPSRPERQPGRPLPRRRGTARPRVLRGRGQRHRLGYGNPSRTPPRTGAYSAIDGNLDTAWITGHVPARPVRPVVAGTVRPPGHHGPHHARAAPTRRPTAGYPRHADLRRQAPGACPARPAPHTPRRGRRSRSRSARSTPCASPSTARRTPT